MRQIKVFFLENRKCCLQLFLKENAGMTLLLPFTLGLTFWLKIFNTPLDKFKAAITFVPHLTKRLNSLDEKRHACPN
jgi:hypothetical protein